jgi:hypothetical protein
VRWLVLIAPRFHVVTRRRFDEDIDVLRLIA